MGMDREMEDIVESIIEKQIEHSALGGENYHHQYLRKSARNNTHILRLVCLSLVSNGNAMRWSSFWGRDFA